MSDVDLKRGLDEAKEESSPSAKKAKTEEAPSPSVKDKKAENGDHKETEKNEV